MGKDGNELVVKGKDINGRHSSRRKARKVECCRGGTW